MSEDAWTISLSRDEGLVLSDYLDRWQQTGDPSFQHDAERVARDNLLALLESAGDGTSFAGDYADQIEEARKKLVEG